MKSGLRNIYLARDEHAHEFLELPAWVKKALSAHWRGRLRESQTLYSANSFTDLNPELASLVAADEILVAAKIGHDLPDWRGPAKPTIFACFIKEYAQYSRLFWRNQREATGHLAGMFRASIQLRSGPGMVMTMFLLGHMRAIQGKRIFGFGFARVCAMLLRKMHVGRSRSLTFYHDITAVFPYTAFVSGKSLGHFREFLSDTEDMLSGDPYYKGLYYLARLLNSAYSGEIAQAEVYARRLNQVHKDDRIEGYSLYSKVMVLLPFALRGYGHLIENELARVLAQVDDCKDPVVHAGYSRAAAVTALYKGDRQRAVELIRAARSGGAATGFRRVWEKLDQEIEQCALGNKPFDPMNNALTRTLEPMEMPPTFGVLITRLLQITAASNHLDDESFAANIAQALSSHFGCQISLSSNVDDRGEALDISARLVVDNSEEHAVATHISTLKPVIQSVEKLYREQRKAEDFSRATSALETARQVAHDIRSPLAALDYLASNIDELPEEKRVLLKMSSARIKEIAEDLLSRKMPKSVEETTHASSSNALPTFKKTLLSPLGSVLAQVVTEKNVGRSADGGGRRVSLEEKGDLYGVFIGVDSAEFKRVLSNLINNALEASPPNLSVSVRTVANSEHVQVDIVDNGCGMTEAQLAKVFESGVSFKQGGNGLGLPHAKQILVSCGGDISIVSEHGVGTTVSLKVLRCSAPPWFLPAITMSDDTNIVVVDDDPPIHQLWKIRFAQRGERAPEMVHFSDPETFTTWWKTVKPSERSRFLVLTDYEFKSTPRNGVDVLETVGGSTVATIVTSHFEDHDVLERCAAKDIKLIPKGMANIVPIVN